MPSTKVIEHPDIFVKESAFEYSDFDYIIELRNTPDEEISYESFTMGFDEFWPPIVKMMRRCGHVGFGRFAQESEGAAAPVPWTIFRTT